VPRKPRFYVPDIPVHVIQRGNNRQAIFFEDNDYYSYLSWLKDASIRYECQIHTYVLMTNHNKATRNERYKVMFAEYLSSDEIDMIRQSSQTGTPLGDDRRSNSSGIGEKGRASITG